MNETRPAGHTSLFTREFWTLMAAASVFFVAIGAVNALLPRFVVEDLGQSEAVAGAVMGAMAITALATRFRFGRFGDRNGARPLFVRGALIASAALASLWWFPDVAGAVGARLGLGAGVAAAVTATTMLAIQIAPPDRRGEAASWALIAFHIGAGVGPLGADLLLRDFSFVDIWLFVSLAFLAAAALGTTLPRRAGSAAAEDGPLLHPRAIGPGIVTFFGIFAFNGFMMFVPLYGQTVGLEQVGPVFTVSSVTIIAIRVLGARIPDRIGPVPAGSAALAVTVLATILVATWETPAGVFVGAALLAAGLSLQSPSFIPLAVDGVPDSQRGAAMATYTAFFDVANAIIGPAFGLIVSGFGYQPAFLFTGAMAAVAVAVLRVVGRRRQPVEHSSH